MMLPIYFLQPSSTVSTTKHTKGQEELGFKKEPGADFQVEVTWSAVLMCLQCFNIPFRIDFFFNTLFEVDFNVYLQI